MIWINSESLANVSDKILNFSVGVAVGKFINSSLALKVKQIGSDQYSQKKNTRKGFSEQ